MSRKGREEAAPACAREGVSTLGELPFRAGNNGMRVARFLPRRFTAAPLQTDVEKTVGFFPSLVGSPPL